MKKNNGHRTNMRSASRNRVNEAEPLIDQSPRQTQAFGSLVHMPIGLKEGVCKKMVDTLNQILADTITLRDLYKKHHWQVAGHTFYSLHLLFDKHAEQQDELVDLIAERIQLLGGIALAMAPDIAETTRIDRPPRGREEVPTQISRLLKAHELIIIETREAAGEADDAKDDGSNDLLVSNVLRTNELQMWFVAEHLVDTRS